MRDCLSLRSSYVADCDWDAYGAQNPDVTNAFGTDHGELRHHFMIFGRKEGRTCVPRANSAFGNEACYLFDTEKGIMDSVDGRAAGRFWASSRAWRTLAAMTDIKGLSISRGRGIETRDDRGRAREG